MQPLVISLNLNLGDFPFRLLVAFVFVIIQAKVPICARNLKKRCTFLRRVTKWALLQNEGEASLSFPAGFNGRCVGGRTAIMAKVDMSVAVAVTDVAAFVYLHIFLF